MVFPIQSLEDATVELIRTVRRHGHDEAIVVGHARDGSLHLTITQPYNSQTEVDRYARFMDDRVELEKSRHSIRSGKGLTHKDIWSAIAQRRQRARVSKRNSEAA